MNNNTEGFALFNAVQGHPVVIGVDNFLYATPGAAQGTYIYLAGWQQYIHVREDLATVINGFVNPITDLNQLRGLLSQGTQKGMAA